MPKRSAKQLLADSKEQTNVLAIEKAGHAASQWRDKYKEAVSHARLLEQRRQRRSARLDNQPSVARKNARSLLAKGIRTRQQREARRRASRRRSRHERV